MHFTAGEMLFRLVDLSQVWVVAQVAEQELPRLTVGQVANFETAAHPGRRFTGKVSFVAPTVDGATRAIQARIELANSGGALKPGMFGRLTLSSVANEPERLTVPVAAVIDSGTRQIVLLARPGGRFEPRAVRTGVRTEQWVEILSGLEAGDLVVSAANFLIDAESNLRGALSGLTPAR
jgi:Cu(I)/Ag(I) efflux system membrane fusion protein